MEPRYTDLIIFAICPADFSSTLRVIDQSIKMTVILCWKRMYKKLHTLRAHLCIMGIFMCFFLSALSQMHKTIFVDILKTNIPYLSNTNASRIFFYSNILITSKLDLVFPKHSYPVVLIYKLFISKCQTDLFTSYDPIFQIAFILIDWKTLFILIT